VEHANWFLWVEEFFTGVSKKTDKLIKKSQKSSGSVRFRFSKSETD
jgi:hypothetical protein